VIEKSSIKSRSHAGRGAASFAIVLLPLCLFATATTGPLPASAQDRTAGLTGVDRADDVVMARQLLMDGIETEMGAIEAATAGQALRLAELQARAEMISTLLTAFPHLFPPQTKPAVAADGSPGITAAAAAIWQDFDGFYDQAQAAATTAFDAGRAADANAFREAAKKLRGSCDGCHAQFMHVAEPPPR
jgi:cytochrome c556